MGAGRQDARHGTILHTAGGVLLLVYDNDGPVLMSQHGRIFMELWGAESRETPILTLGCVSALFHICDSEDFYRAFHGRLVLSCIVGDIIQFVERSYEHEDSYVRAICGRMMMVFSYILLVHLT